MTLILSGSDGVTFPDSTEQETGYANGIGFRNRIINGDMRIDQRNAGASVTPTATAYTLDRWQATVSASSKFSVQQNAGSVTPPVGLTKYLGCTSLSAYSVGVDDYFMMRQAIEGFNIADLGWGTANAQPVTISFRVYSSLTGTFGGAIENNASNRSYPFSYTVSASNTWETKTVTIAGDTAGTWETNNGIGLILAFGLGVGTTYSGTAGAWGSTRYFSATGATSVVGTNGATFYITGVQLEVGSVATPFERRPYGTELSLCQRYFTRFETSNFFAQECWAYAANDGSTRVPLPTVMRAAPTMTIGGTIGDNTQDWSVYNNGAWRTLTVLGVENSNLTSFRINMTVSSGIAASDAFGLYAQNADGGASLTASAEL